MMRFFSGQLNEFTYHTFELYCLLFLKKGISPMKKNPCPYVSNDRMNYKNDKSYLI